MLLAATERAEISAGASAPVSIQVPPHEGLAVVEGLRDQCVSWGVLVTPLLIPPSAEGVSAHIEVFNAGRGHTIVYEPGDVVAEVALVSI